VQDYTEFSRLLLVSAGIGITPTVSILRDILHRGEEQRAGGNTDACAGTPGGAVLEQVAVHWVIREHLSVAWFVEQCLGDALAVDATGVLTATVHLTGTQRLLLWRSSPALSAVERRAPTLHATDVHKLGAAVVQGTGASHR
jgi:hypothetical protein